MVSGFRVDYLSPTLYGTDLLLAVLFSHYLLFHKIHTEQLRKRFLPYGFFLVFLIITIIQASMPLAGLYSLVKICEFLFFGWFTARHLGLRLYTRIIPLLFALTVSLEAFLALLHVAHKGALGGLLYFLGERTITSLTPGAATTVLNGEVFLRAYGTFSHPNVLAGFLVIGMVYIFYNRTAFSFSYGLLFWWTSFFVGTLGLLMTLSRIPILLWSSFLIIQGVLFFWQRRNSKLPPFTWQYGIVIVAILLFIVLSMFSPLVTRFSQTSLSEESVLVRTDLTKIAVTLIREHPLLGVGLNNFLFHSVSFKKSETPLFFAVQPVHNIFLLVMVETGILGIFTFLWFLVRSFYHASSTTKRLLGLLLFLGLFDHYLLTLQQGQLLFAFVLGLAWVNDKTPA